MLALFKDNKRDYIVTFNKYGYTPAHDRKSGRGPVLFNLLFYKIKINCAIIFK